MITVVSTADGPADGILPPTRAVARGAGRVYRFYQTNAGDNYAFNDVDGETLVECRSFKTFEAAHRSRRHV
jgi:hypothetical protein